GAGGTGVRASSALDGGISHADARGLSGIGNGMRRVCGPCGPFGASAAGSAARAAGNGGSCSLAVTPLGATSEPTKIAPSTSAPGGWTVGRSEPVPVNEPSLCSGVKSCQYRKSRPRPEPPQPPGFATFRPNRMQGRVAERTEAELWPQMNADQRKADDPQITQRTQMRSQKTTSVFWLLICVLWVICGSFPHSVAVQAAEAGREPQEPLDALELVEPVLNDLHLDRISGPHQPGRARLA